VTEQQDVIADLIAEGEDVERMVAAMSEEQWSLPTPAEGWTIAHQIAHLAATFRMAGLAAADPDGFLALMSRLDNDFNKNVANALAGYLADPPAVLFRRWHDERVTAVTALAAVPGDRMVPWLVNPLPPAILASAGMMELFAHGQDIADALGVRRPATTRLRHLVAFAARTWNFGYLSRGLEVPDVEFRFELTGPDGEVWAHGPADSAERVSGPAQDFCLLVTRRRHHADLAITATGPEATRWLDIAQAYRGPAGEGRKPGQFATATR
jgi:enediyne biosynthesis protein E11